MKTNIFLNIQFGELFKTRDGRKAVCDGVIEGLPYFSIEGYKEHGMIYLSGDNDITFLTPWLEDGLKGGGDIVSKWFEPMSEEKLDDIVEENTHEKYYYTQDMKGLENFQIGFKAGFQTAEDYYNVSIQ